MDPPLWRLKAPHPQARYPEKFLCNERARGPHGFSLRNEYGPKKTNTATVLSRVSSSARTANAHQGENSLKLTVFATERLTERSMYVAPLMLLWRVYLSRLGPPGREPGLSSALRDESPVSQLPDNAGTRFLFCFTLSPRTNCHLKPFLLHPNIDGFGVRHPRRSE